MCKLKEIKIKVYKFSDEDEDMGGDSEGRINPNLPYLNNPCDGLAPDEAILYMKEESTNPQKLRILFLTELKKNQEEMQVLIFDIEDDRKLPNIVMGKFDGGSFTIKAGSYNIEKDTYGKMYVIVDLL